MGVINAKRVNLLSWYRVIFFIVGREIIYIFRDFYMWFYRFLIEFLLIYYRLRLILFGR